jgi:hypothetical protein
MVANKRSKGRIEVEWLSKEDKGNFEIYMNPRPESWRPREDFEVEG